MRQEHQHCTVSGCTLKHKSRGYCATHYAQWFRGIKPDQPIQRRDSNPSEHCSVTGCEYSVKAKGLCDMHYARSLRHGHVNRTDRIRPRTVCVADGCDSYAYAKGLCNLHYTHTRNMAQYGIDAAEYQRMLASQGGCCAICSGQEKMLDSRTKKTRMMSVDHDHVTGRVRGILCSHCNRAIGLLGDSFEIASKAAAYLKPPS